MTFQSFLFNFDIRLFSILFISLQISNQHRDKYLTLFYLFQLYSIDYISL